MQVQQLCAISIVSITGTLFAVAVAVAVRLFVCFARARSFPRNFLSVRPIISGLTCTFSFSFELAETTATESNIVSAEEQSSTIP